MPRLFTYGFSRLLSQEPAQLCAVLLYMTQIVQLKLRKGSSPQANRHNR